MDWNNLVNVALGGSGVTILIAFGKLIKDRRDGKLIREDKAISRYKDIAKQNARSANKGWRLVNWYKTSYSLLWAEYMSKCGTEEDRHRFPPSPPPDIDTPDIDD